MKPLLITVGNIYIDHNVFGVNGGIESGLRYGKEYLASSGERVLGGSAVNAAMQFRRFGSEVAFIGKTGTDAGADEVRSLLKAQGILSDLVFEDATCSTSMSIDLIGKHGEFIGVNYGTASRNLDANDININHELFKQSGAIYFGGTAKQPLLFEGCAELFKKLTAKGMKVFYDPNRFPAEEVLTDVSLLQAQLSNITGYFPNEEELLQATATDSIDEALEQVLRSGVGFVALKRGAAGCRIRTKNQDILVAGKEVEVVTTVGAGDCFNAAFIYQYLHGASLRACAEYATIAASIKVSQNIWPDAALIESVAEQG